jgi:hypothetical protein
MEKHKTPLPSVHIHRSNAKECKEQGHNNHNSTKTGGKFINMVPEYFNSGPVWEITMPKVFVQSTGKE